MAKKHEEPEKNEKEPAAPEAAKQAEAPKQPEGSKQKAESKQPDALEQAKAAQGLRAAALGAFRVGQGLAQHLVAAAHPQYRCAALRMWRYDQAGCGVVRCVG